MGQCYSVYLNVKVKDPSAFVLRSQEFFDKMGWSASRDMCSTIDKTFKWLLGDNLTVDYENGWPVFRSDFDACYSWDGTMEAWFRDVSPTLEAGSEIEVYPDSGSWTCAIREDGAIVKDYGEEEEEDD